MRVARSLLLLLVSLLVVSTGTVVAGAATSPRPIGAVDAVADTARPAGLTIKRAKPGLVVTGQRVGFLGTAPKASAGRHAVLQRRVGKRGAWVVVARPKVASNGTIATKAGSTGVGTNSWRLTLKTGRTTLVSPVVTHRVYGWFFLADRDPVQSVRFTEDSVRIGGKSHPKSVRNSYDFWWESEPWAEWNLSYRCVRFEAEIGLTDDSVSDGQVGFVAALDGAQTDFGTKTIGLPTHVSLDTTGRLRLRLTDQYVSGPTGSGQGYFWGAWGSARVLCAGDPG
ncbi:hypothetical protein GCM10023340_26680 [Nocardioides marinquilinus]|uniref:Glycosyl hydrolase family 98 putative carbohydrate-binding module domain-containing protein n=1 Tax=Nocardioides marinquilinus TaxID=1210400 RepID=A0ABP9PPW5_9ACTN